MSDLFTTANTVSAWAITLPPKLKSAIQVFDEAAYADYEAFPPKVETVTLKNIAELITEYARDRATQDAWGQAKQMIRSQLAQQVLRTAQEHAADIRKAESVEFDKVVKVFVENALLLPDSLSADDLIKAGGSAVSAFHVAADAATQLAKWDSWVASLYDLPRWAGNPIEPYLRIVEPSSRKQYRELVNAESDSGIPGNYLYAAKNGVAFVLHLPDEITELRDRLNAEDEPSQFPGLVRFAANENGGQRLVKADGTPVGA